MEDMAEVGGNRQRWRRLSVDGGVASNGVAVVASLVAVVRWATIMGMRERERVKEREKKKNEKETRGWPTQDGCCRRHGAHQKWHGWQ